MPIAFRCQCGKHYLVPSNMAGRYARCRRCATRILIPGQTLEEMDLPPPAMLGPFGFITFLFSLGALVCALVLPWMAVNLIVQVAAILFACIVMLVAGYYGGGYALPLLSILLTFVAFLLVLIVPDALERLVQFRNNLRERSSEQRGNAGEQPASRPDSKPSSAATRTRPEAAGTQTGP